MMASLPQTLPAPRVLASRLKFPEGPRWHRERLWFSDMHAHRVMSMLADGEDIRVEAEVDDMPSGLGWLPDGTLVYSSMRKRQVLAVSGGTSRVIGDLAEVPGQMLNDMLTDDAGRTYVGNRFHRRRLEAGPDDRPESVVRVDPDGQVSVAAADMVAPNGTVLSPDGRTMIVAETRAHRLTAFSVAPDGTLSERRVFAEVGEEMPDGICLDAEGAVWFGSPQTGRFLRVREGGEVLAVIETPGRWAIACMLGGPGRRTLFLCTARTTLENLGRLRNFEADLASESEGWIEAVDVEVPGAGLP